MMSYRWKWLTLTVAVAMGGLFRTCVSTCPAAEPNLPAAPVASEEAEPLLRGPLHEAFAEPVPLNPQAATIVPKQPPEPIEELPPEAKPADENSIWIPGYWAWDDEREDFIYVSGVWRVPPQDRRWVPGYWAQADGGYQWVSGFWAPIEVEEVQYLPDPPQSLESGPNSPAPSTEHYWVSGNWCYQNDRYAWRPGYWNTYREGWVWVPAHYVWTPLGAVFVDGYWDCPFSRRGVVFAPVCFPRPIYLRRGYCYTPSVVIDVSHLLMHLFVHPRRCHYYWGDYYDYHRHRGHHFYSCLDYHGRHGYDPVFAYYNAYHRHRHIDYTQRLRGWHDYFREHKEYRPPHTLHGQAQFAARVERNADLKYAMLGHRLDDVVSGRGGPAHFERISATHRQNWADAARQTRELTHRRIDVETHHKPVNLATRHTPPTRVDGPARIGGKADAPRPPVKLKLPELPRVAGFQPARLTPERPDKPRPVERAELPKIGRGGSVPDRLRSDLGNLRDQPKPSERDSIRPPVRSLPDVSKLRQPDATPSPKAAPRKGTPRDVTPKIDIPRVPEFSRPDLGSARGSPSSRNLGEGGPKAAIPRAAPTPDRTPSFKVPDRGPSPRTGPMPDRTFKMPDRAPSVRLPSPRIEAPPAARQEVRRPQFSIPKLPSAPPPQSRSMPNLESRSSAVRPRFEMPNTPSNVSRVDRPRPQTMSRQVPRPEFKSRDVPGARSAPSHAKSGRQGPPSRTQSSGRHKR